MKQKVKRIIILIIGWFFIILGIVGLFLPMLQGVLFLLLGLCILSMESHRAQKLLNMLTRRWPHLHDKIERVREKQKELLRRLFGS